MKIEPFYDERTNTLTYVVFEEATRDAVVIDPVLDYEPAASKVWTESVDRVVDFLQKNALRVHFILETHAHADHLSGAQTLKRTFPDAQLAVGEKITQVQKTFKMVLDLPDEFPTDGRQFDRLLKDAEVVEAGSLSFRVIFTPGHTPACACYLFEDAVFTGDAMFMPDMGTGRCDFPMGSAEDLYESITTRLYALPDDTRVFVGHDYQPDGRELAYMSTIGEQKAGNKQLREGTSRADFVRFRNDRDQQLSAPRLLFQSVQINIDAGAMPRPNEENQRYLKIPINIFRPESDGDLELSEMDDAR